MSSLLFGASGDKKSGNVRSSSEKSLQRLSAAEIWNIYNIPAEIADQQSQPDRAAEYRGLARDAKRGFAGTAHEMKRYLPVILGT